MGWIVVVRLNFVQIVGSEVSSGFQHKTKITINIYQSTSLVSLVDYNAVREATADCQAL